MESLWGANVLPDFRPWGKITLGMDGMRATVASLLFLLGLGWAQAQDTYNLSPEELPFVATELQLEEGSRQQLAQLLTNFARTLANGDDEERQLSARALVIALGLDPQYRPAVLAKARIRHGDKLKAPKEKVDREALAQHMAKTATMLVDLGDTPDKALAAYLIDLAYIAAPDNEDVIFEAELLKPQTKMSVSWPRLTGYRPDITKAHQKIHGKKTSNLVDTVMEKAKKMLEEHSGLDSSQDDEGWVTSRPVHHQVQVNGLVVLSTGGDMIGGKVMEINATMRKIAGPSRADFVTRVANDMKISKDEALRLAFIKVPEAKQGKRIRFSFDDKYSHKAGGSAGTAFCVAMLALTQEISLDPKVAMTGDISVDGDVLKVGGIGQKIRGAARESLQYVGIPSENKEDVAIMPLLGGLQDFADIQIFSLETVDDALDLAREDRPSQLTAAMAKFAEFQEAVKGSYLRSELRKKENRAILEETLELAPHHLSARFLLDAAQGKLPRRLTHRSSLDESFLAFGPMLILLTPGDRSSPRSDLYQFTTSQIRGVLGRYKKLEGKIHPKAEDVFFGLRNFVIKVEVFQDQFGEVPHFRAHRKYLSHYSRDLKRVNMLQDLRDQWRKVYDQLNQLDYDEKFKEELLR